MWKRLVTTFEENAILKAETVATLTWERLLLQMIVDLKSMRLMARQACIPRVMRAWRRVMKPISIKCLKSLLETPEDGTYSSIPLCAGSGRSWY